MTVAETSAADTSADQRADRGTQGLPTGFGSRVGAGGEVANAARTAASFLPDTKRLLYYGALGALVAAEMLEWPVAVAIGVGTEVARRTAGPTSGGGLAGGRPLAQPPGQARAEGSGDAARSSGGDTSIASGADEDQTEDADKSAGRRRTTSAR